MTAPFGVRRLAAAFPKASLLATEYSFSAASQLTGAKRQHAAHSIKASAYVKKKCWTHQTRSRMRALAALIVRIALINVWNRLNVTTRQVAGEWAKSAEARKWVESGTGSR